jgi:putative oxidoreductase
MKRLLELLIALLFAYAGAAKVLDPATFARDVENYRLLPAIPSALVALYLPWLELLTALALGLNRLRAASLLLLLAMSAFFTAALATAWARGLDISCGCFGTQGGSVVPALIRAGVLLACLSWLLTRELRTDSPHPA